MIRLIFHTILMVWLLFLGGGLAEAQEIVTYNHDALGRLSGVSHSGGPSNGVVVTYAYDPANNRTNYNSSLNAVLNIAGASANEGTALVFTVTRSGVTSTAVTVGYASSNSAAIAGTNYTATTGTLTFATGVTSATIAVPTIDDHVTTPNLTMALTLSSPSGGAIIGTASATGTVINIDTVWTSILTAGSSQTCPHGSCTTRTGFGPALGSMTVTSFEGYTITVLQALNGNVNFTSSGTAIPPNSGWTSIAVPGVGTLQRSAATYSTSGTTATWSWAGSYTVTSGTVTIQ